MNSESEPAQIILEGQRRLQLGDFSSAQKQFEAALVVDPSNASAYRGLGEVYFLRGDFTAAEKWTRRAFSIAPDDWHTLNNLGVLWSALKDFPRAENALVKASSASQHELEPHRNLLRLYAQWCRHMKPERGRDSQIIQSASALMGTVSEQRKELQSYCANLRQPLLDRYGNARTSEHRILLHRPSNGALKYLMESWCEILNFMGVPTALQDWADNTQECLNRFQPTVFITVGDHGYLATLDGNTLRSYRQNQGLKIGHISVFKEFFEPCDFLITFHLDPQKDTTMSRAPLPLLSLPFAANPLRHFVQGGEALVDYFFVGTNSHLKARETTEFLAPIVESFDGILAGVGWQFGVGELPVATAAQLYQLAVVAPNYHLEVQRQEFNEINERTYVIAACGGFQVTDRPAALGALFNDDEMCAVDSGAQFREAVNIHLSNSTYSESFVRNGMKRVYESYTLFHVLDRLCDYLKIERSTGNSARN